MVGEICGQQQGLVHGQRQARRAVKLQFSTALGTDLKHIRAFNARALGQDGGGHRRILRAETVMAGYRAFLHGHGRHTVGRRCRRRRRNGHFGVEVELGTRRDGNFRCRRRGRDAVAQRFVQLDRGGTFDGVLQGG